MLALAIEGALATVTLGRPPVNAIDDAWLAQLDEIVTAVERDAPLAAVLVRSSTRAFSAGADLALMRRRFDSPEGRAQMVALAREMQRVFARIENSTKVWIAEIGGAALGGGFELALACDLRVVADGAQVGLPEARLGLVPGAGGTQRLTRVCGAAAAKRLILGAEVIDGAEAARLGVVHWSFAAAELPAQARAVAERVAGLPPPALAACKRCIGAALAPGTKGFELELVSTATLLADAETQARVRAFLDRRS